MAARMLATLRTDVTVQVRNRLYAIGIAVALLFAVGLSQLSTPETLGNRIPTFMLLAVGGTTLLYVAGMILFEKDEGTINALIVSPLTTNEYLLSKVLTLTALATLEGAMMFGGAALLMGPSTFATFNAATLLFGIMALGVVYTLIGVVIVVRYRSITDFLVPVVMIASVLQLPSLHFIGLIESYAFYIIPTTAQTLIMSAAWEPIAIWEWAYALGYTAFVIVGLYIWSVRAFGHHIVSRVS